MKKIYQHRVTLAFVCTIFCCLAGAQKIHIIASPNSTNSSPSNFYRDAADHSFAVLNSVAYFIATVDSAQTNRVWRSDGTAAGTYMFSGNAGVRSIGVVNNQLYTSDVSTDFIDFNGYIYYSSGNALLKLNPAGGASVEVKSYASTIASTLLSSHLIKLDNNLFFILQSWANAPTVTYTYISDGSGPGTVLLDVNKGNSNLTVLNGKLYFINSGKLYVNAGSPDAGSSQEVKNTGSVTLIPGTANMPVQALNNVLYFPATGSDSARELYQYDPTTADGIMPVKNVLGGAGDAGISINSMYVAGGTLYFGAADANGNMQLWKSDGSTTGTVLVKDFGMVHSSDLTHFTNVNGSIYFNFYNDTYGNELWKTDGTETGTVLVQDINPGIYSSSPSFLTPLGAGSDELLFASNDGVHGRELWKTSGPGQTELVKDINTGFRLGPNPQIPNATGNSVKLGNFILFDALDDNYGAELWKSDGTMAGTQLVKDIFPGAPGSYPQGFTANNGTAYFFTDSALTGKSQLWKTDGTADGTVLIKRFDYNAKKFITGMAAGSNEYFLVFSGGINELWRTDGTEGGTLLITALPASLTAENLMLTPVGDALYFTHSHAVWKTTGNEPVVVLSDEDPDDENGFFVVYMVSLKPATLIVLRNGSNPYYFYILNSAGLKTLFERPESLRTDHFVFKNKLYFNRYDEFGAVTILDALDSAGRAPGYLGTDAAMDMVAASGNKFYFTYAGSPPFLHGLQVYDTETDVVQPVAKLNTWCTTCNTIINGANDDGRIFFMAGGNTLNLGYTDGSYGGTRFINETLLNAVYASFMGALNDKLLLQGKSNYPPPLDSLPNMLLTIDTDTFALPVTLTGFTAKLQNGNGLLNWSTATEQNSSYFSVLRSTDGHNFSAIGNVPASGNAGYSNQYSYTDYALAKLGADKVFYRLQQFDKDGRFAYSKIVTLNINSSFKVYISPVPVVGKLNVNIASTRPQTLLITITDASGKTMISVKKTVGAGNTTLSNNITGWAKGLYLVQVTQADGTKQTISVIK